MERLKAERPPRPVRAGLRSAELESGHRLGEEPGRNPILELQRDAGNAAVVQLLAVQRHTLNPEEEAGSS